MDISQIDFDKLCAYIYRKAGISIGSSKYNSLSRKLIKLFEDKGYNDFRNFYHDLRFNTQLNLIQELINVVTVNETYFYREKHQFEILIEHTLYELDEQRPANRPLRILCAPCSTGEEPYSIALHLLAEGHLVEKRDIEIVGIDIDTTVIEKAKEGKYLKRSVQFLPPKLLKEYFTHEGFFYKIADFLIDAINFKVVNVMEKNTLATLGKFDVIFSRNMLIYFDDASKREVVLNFYEMLNKGGYLFLGHADNINRASSLFKTMKINNSLVYKKEVY